MTSLNKTVSVLVTAIAALGLSQAAKAGQTLVLDLNTPYQNGVGGEFKALDNDGVGGTFALHGYASTTSTGTSGALTSFDTFCVQGGTDDVTFNPGQKYGYSVSTQILGGPANGVPLDPRALNQGVEWLYMEFATGQLAGYDFTNSGGNRWKDAGELQNEIWFLEGEISSAGASNPFAADLAGAGTLSGNYGVEVLNLWTINSDGAVTGPAQNQLIYNNGGFGGNGNPNVPDNGMTIALLGVSFLGLALFRRTAAKA
jgi:hypothetical protein